MALMEIGSIIISIHAPREGGDVNKLAGLTRRKISIHAPREGGDGDVDWAEYNKKHFNPRPPRGGRLRLYRVGGPER